MNNTELNIGNSLFKDLNDKQGLMLCGYEWGDSNDEQIDENPINTEKKSCTFANKWLHHGEIARTWRYDNTIKKWFSLWGHELNGDNPSDFEKSIVQTNWCNTQAHHMPSNKKQKLLHEEQIDNFIYHISELKPKLIFFFGSECINALNCDVVYDKFTNIVGKETSKRKVIQKDIEDCTKFKISFQTFENCQIVCLPHASGSRGLKDAYFQAFHDEIGSLINEYKKFKKINH